MTMIWVLVANASEARLFLNRGCNKGLELVKEMHHPDSRKKGVDLVADAPGRMQQSFSPGARPAMEPATQPKEVEAQRFAQELAQQLQSGRTGNQYDRLVLVAPPSFLGLLRDNLDGPTAGLILDTLNKDYTKSDGRELVTHLSKIMCP